MSTRTLDRTALDTLRRNFTGALLAPGDPGYEGCRTLFNAMIDRHPALIAQCRTEDDVAAAIRFGRQTGSETAVRGGGHGVAGTCTTEGGLVVDLRHLDSVTVDPDARTATVGGGATMADLDAATQPYRLATTGGRVSTTGVGGFLLGGGSGWLDRTFGLACDNLVAADLITADGSKVHTDATTEPDLFWALHGGGGNFGAVTSFTLRLHPLAALTAALLIWRPEEGPEVTRAYRDFIAGAPDSVGGGLIYVTAPDEPFVPEDLTGSLACLALVTYTGPEQEAREVLEPLLRLAPAGEMIAEMPYAELQSMLDDPPGYRNYWSAEHLQSLPDEAVDVFCRKAHEMIVPSPSQHVLFPQGGAVDDDPHDYPVPWRHAPWTVHPFGLWSDPVDDDRAVAWARGLLRELRPWTSGSVYLNFIGQEGHDRLVNAFGPRNYERLTRIKARYDPGNTFHLNHNVPPASGS
ncbi:oxidoreductase [Streptomyces daqingensis]|uniref:Oxidoreductase n=1 Tax=Streptomyces daqingensis TaxID=1472640 RepID=A0ABQ2LSS8_9ACTN|nr:FAD-binding oxidoreductase [Streptomyces daqingensis]GGO42718.1 oxidoreductase [Streptomyces daqingensis]